MENDGHVNLNYFDQLTYCKSLLIKASAKCPECKLLCGSGNGLFFVNQ